MPTYVYETLRRSPDEDVERFEVKQGFDEAPLEKHPTTGRPVRRVISGGLGLVGLQKGASPKEAPPACGPESCTCGRFG